MTWRQLELSQKKLVFLAASASKEPYVLLAQQAVPGFHAVILHAALELHGDVAGGELGQRWRPRGGACSVHEVVELSTIGMATRLQ
jgi:hypothetical protein